MLRRLLNGESKSLSGAALMLGAASFVSRFIGVFRDRILAGEFGAGAELDIYYAAFRVPDFLFNLLVLGALSAGFIPLFTKALHRDGTSQEGWAFLNTLLNMLVIVLGGFALLLFFAVPLFINVLVPGFSDADRATAVVLTRIMLLSPILLGVSSLFGGVLQTFRRFFVYSLAPIFYNLGIIIGALYLVPRVGLSGLAWGVALGSFLHCAIQFPVVRMLGFRYQFLVRFRDSNLRALLRLMLPRTFSLAITQINFIVMTIIASTLPRGSLSIFQLANNLQSFPLGIFGIPYAIAVFPLLADAAARQDHYQFVRHFSSAFRQILFFLIPSIVLFLFLKAQIVRAILGTGAFSWEDTVNTFQTLVWFSLSLWAQALSLLVIRAFWAREDTKTPAFLGFLSVLVNIPFAFVFGRWFGVQGLAAAFSISSIIHFFFLWVFLHRRIGRLDERRILWSSSKMMVAAFFMAIGIQIVKVIMEPLVGTKTFIGITTQGVIAGIIGCAIYFGISWFLRSSEFLSFLHGLKRRFLPRPEQLELFER